MKSTEKILALEEMQRVRVRFTYPQDRGVEDRPATGWDFETTGSVECVASINAVEGPCLVILEDSDERSYTTPVSEQELVFRSFRLRDIYSVKVLP